jgi:hypothetical protein
VSVVLLDPGLSGSPGLTSIDFATLAGDAVDESCFQAKVILDRLKETGILLMWLKIGPTKVKKTTDVSSSLCVSSLQGGWRDIFGYHCSHSV